MSMLEEYRKCAEICSKIDYSNRATIRANNRGVTKMYKIVEGAERQGPSAISELSTLLDEPLSAAWLSHQLLERAAVTPDIEKKCLNIIHRLSMNEYPVRTIDTGEQMWLKNWYSKNNKLPR
jgi:hypothetical protein